MAEMTIQQALALAMRHHQSGRQREAESLYRQVLAAQPNQPDALHLLGAIALDAGNAPAAIELISRAISANPSAAVFHGNLGLALQRAGRLDEAIASLRQALSLSGGRFPDAWFNLGNALRDIGQLDGAVGAYQHALALQPAHRKAMNNLGNALHLLGRLDEAMDIHQKTLQLAPEWPLARYNRGITLLFQGDFERGWPEYEQRLSAPELPLPAFKFNSPRWDGSELKGKRILVYSDQGFGDAFFAMRYIPMIAQEKRGHVIVACQSELERLARGIAGVREVVTQVDANLHYDVHAAMMSLPYLFKTTLATIPQVVPYISADPHLRAQWQARLAAARGAKIGIAWSGRAYPVGRSIPIEMLADGLKNFGGVTFVNLQKGASSKDLQTASQNLPFLDLSADIADFADTSALVDNLDLVITVDTAVAHLAGAMGKPTWVLLQHVPDWRWLLDRDDSPWYPTMKLFRQPAPQDWQSVVRAVTREMEIRFTA
jgi:Flp pilus assembly protein TadD